MTSMSDDELLAQLKDALTKDEPDLTVPTEKARREHEKENG